MKNNYIEITLNPESLKYSENIFRFDLTSEEQQQARKIISDKLNIDNKHYIKDCTLSRLLFEGYVKDDDSAKRGRDI